MWFGRENDENVVRTREWCGWPSSPRTTHNQSSRYNPIFSCGMIFSSLLSIYNPTNSATPAPSYAPIVTSKFALHFFIQGLPSIYKTHEKHQQSFNFLDKRYRRGDRKVVCSSRICKARKRRKGGFPTI